MKLVLKRKFCFMILCFISVLPLFTTLAVASTTGGFTISTESISNNLEEWLFALIFGVGILGQGYWISRLIRQNDDSHKAIVAEMKESRKELADVNDKQWKAIGNLINDLAQVASEYNRLRGEHDIIRSICPNGIGHIHTRKTDLEEAKENKE